MIGGKDHTPKPPEFIKLQSEIVNQSLNNVTISQEEMKELVRASLGSGWIRLHPESLENIPTWKQAKPGASPDAMNNQNNVGKHREEFQTGLVLVMSSRNSQTYFGHNWNR